MNLGLPVLDGPLCAFRVAEQAAADAPVYLGGDLHAIRPGGDDRHSGRRHDRSLASARITIDHEGGSVGTTALEGLWCLLLPEGPLHSMTFFAITDSQGCLRIWLLLPPARTMIGVAHLWLRRVPPPPGSPGG
jgi:hypothetical protein